MLGWRSYGEGVGGARGHIQGIQRAGLLDQHGGNRDRKLGQEEGHQMRLGLLAQVEVQRLDGFLSSLLGREAGPLVPPGLGSDPGHF